MQYPITYDMKKNDVLALCRYYKGENDAPKGVHASMWNYERVWVDFMMDENNTMLQNILKDYISAGLAHFNVTDDTPITLKALLFNRYVHWNSPYGNADGFKDWYRKEYIKER